MIKKYNITVSGVTYEVEVEELGTTTAVNRTQPTAVQPQAAPKVQSVTNTKPVANVSTTGANINAPMPGTIMDVKVSEGQQVKKGDVLLILEAMKMENEIMSPHDGKIQSVSVTKGSSVSSGDLLVTLG